ncbi:MAG TPA: peptidyl-prolyl cis-trans isomerase [Candidatus Eisenbacteria bacterium]|nr:peptidyl-prolyl cis-trans isomerase [Candidatus Eisenbacteria bacterium]
MNRRSRALLGLALLWNVAIPAVSRAAEPAASAPLMTDRERIKASLPDSFVLARVGPRVIRVTDYVNAYFAAYAPDRPHPDSLGRVEFLNIMINKEVLGQTALAINRPMGFEDRLVLREHNERLLSNALFRRFVLDSVSVTEDDVRKAHAQYGWENRYHRIRFDQPIIANRARHALAAGTLKWRDAVKRYAAPGDSAGPDGLDGWIRRNTLTVGVADQIWDLKPGEVSPVVPVQDHYEILKMVERRKVDQPAITPLRPILKAQILDVRASRRADRLQSQVGSRIGLVYDTTNVQWAAKMFEGYEAVQHDAQGVVLDLSGDHPEFQPGDTARVLARYRGGRLSLGDFLHVYEATSPIMRQPVSDFESFRVQIDAAVLQPYMAEEARTRGLEKDPDVIALLEKKREELMVDHMFQDSVQSKVWVPSEERRRYYDEHIAQYVTFAKVRYASLWRPTRQGADSLAARLKAGERAEDVLRADSLRGMKSGSISERREDEKGPYGNILFGELKPGQSTVVGPDKDGTYLVLQVVEYVPGQQLPYEQVQTYVEESVQNVKAEMMLKDLIARQSKRYKIERHPELVMRIWLQDPTARMD